LINLFKKVISSRQHLHFTFYIQMKKLNLGCGMDIKKWYINMDIVQLPWVDIIHDIEKTPYPFSDNFFDEIYTDMVLEHIHNLPKVMAEMVRIGKNWCKIKIIVPYHSSPNLWWDPTHLRWFNTNTFWGFHPNSFPLLWNFIVEKYRIHFLSNENSFMRSKKINIIPDFFINILPKVYERFFSYIFPSSEIHYLIIIKK